MDFSTQLSALTERIRAAAASKTPLRIRGGGSKDFYGHATIGETLETRAFSGIVSYEPSELVVTAMAGTPLDELEAALAAQGQYLRLTPLALERLDNPPWAAWWRRVCLVRRAPPLGPSATMCSASK